MLLPAVQYGEWQEVKKRMKRIVTRIKRDESIVDVMTEGGMLETATTPGVLLVGGTMRGGRVAFHCHVPWKLLVDALRDIRVEANEALEARIVHESLSVPWGVLGLLVYENTQWFWGHTEWFEPFLDAVLRIWDELDSVGARYYIAVQGERLWSIPSTLHYVLANMGVPTERLNAPLPPGGLRALLKYARAAS